MAKSCKKALIVITEDTEEIEFTIVADVLRRAKMDVCVAGLDGKDCVKCNWGVKICPDDSFANAKNDEYDIVILPGGQGTGRFKASSEIGALLQKQEKSGKWIAAVCAAPTVLKVNGIAKGKKVTSYPVTRDEMIEGGEYIYSEEKTVVDEKLITSRGPGTTFDFALTIVENLIGKSVRDKISEDLVYNE